MAIEPKLEIKQSQSLLITPQLRQAINLLQMSNLELNSLINEELAANPLLEREDGDQPEEGEPAEKNIDDYDPPAAGSDEESFSPDIDYDNEFDDDGSDREGYDIPETYGWKDYALNKNAGNSPSPDFDFFEQKLSAEKSLYDIINEQINTAFSSSKEKIIAAVLKEQLDDSGYFRGDIGQISQKLHIRPLRIQKILNRMKSFEPTGIFAENLAECIALQLQEQNLLTPDMKKLLQHLNLLADGKYKELSNILKIHPEALTKMIRLIRQVNPKPTADYFSPASQYIIPDIFVRRAPDRSYIVELNNMSLPRLLINRRYYIRISQSEDKNKNTKRYLKTQLNNAGFLIKALNQRASAILRVSEEIVKNQYDFFEKGINFLKPLTLKDIADAAEMHESTVSRVTTGKYMHTPLGIFELKYFFSTAAGSYRGDENTSARSICHKIKKYIENEKTDNILSDDNISEQLAREGFKVARRTVAKYRESMGIPSSSLRRRQKKLKTLPL